MNTIKTCFKLSAALLILLEWCTGCETTDGGSAQIHNNYYGVGFNDPWYHGDYHDDGDIIVIPPPGNPPDQDLRPTHPIASPPQVSRPNPPPRPSIPTRPRPAPRGGGRR